MKKILPVVTIILLFFTACEKDLGVNLDIPGAENYSQLYMPLAVNTTVDKPLSIIDTAQSLTYSAFLGGPTVAKEDISIQFGVEPALVDSFNTKNGTSYSILPDGSYSLEKIDASIPAGKNSTGLLKLSIKTLGFIQPFQSYLLPVSISSKSNAALNSSLRTTYYVITGSYAQGQVPREKVLSLGANAGTIFTGFYGNDLVLVDPSNGDLLRYTPDANGVLGNPKLIGTGWDVFNTVFFYGGNRLIGRRISNGNLVSFTIDNNNAYSTVSEIGQGWNVFTTVIPYKSSLLGITAAGSMTMYPLNAFGGFGGAKSIGAGWNTFSQIIPYQNSLLAIEPNGTMWQYPLSEEGAFGGRTRVGTGWNKYKLVIPSGTDLLGLDDNGDLWKYKFNPIGLWPL